MIHKNLSQPIKIVPPHPTSGWQQGTRKPFPNWLHLGAQTSNHDESPESRSEGFDPSPHQLYNALEIPISPVLWCNSLLPWYEARDSYLLIQGKHDHESLLNGDIPSLWYHYQESAAANHKPCWIRKHILRSTKKIASKKIINKTFHYFPLLQFYRQN